jgi:hypothetical protein
MFDERPVCQQGAGEQSEFMRQTGVKFMRQTGVELFESTNPV